MGASYDWNALDRAALDIYGRAQSDWLLRFCQKVVAACAAGRRLERDLEAEQAAHRYTREHLRAAEAALGGRSGWAALTEGNEE